MLLPIADIRAVRRTTLRLMHAHRGRLTAVLALHGVAAAAGLAGPLVIGRLIDDVTRGAATQVSVTLAVAVVAGAFVLQALVTRFAQLHSLLLGETVFARLREDFMDTVTTLPLSVIERAGTGDLLARTTNDVESVARTVRFGVPRVLVASMTAAITVIAAVLVNPLVSLALLAGIPVLVASTVWYLRRSAPAYRRQLAAHARIAGAVSETVEGVTTVEALRLAPVQRRKIDAAIDERRQAELRTLWLRTWWYPATDFAFLLPSIAGLLWGGWLVGAGTASVGQVTTVVLYAMQLVGPVSELINWMGELQVGSTALSRIIGVGEVPPDRHVGTVRPSGERLALEAASFAYRPGVTVLDRVDLDIEPGSRIAVVGPSGSGKSTIARLLAGISPPTSGRATVGGADLTELPEEELRGHVALVTQEHHVFVGTVADNLRLAAPDADDAELEEVLAVVGALGWVRMLPEGTATVVGSGGLALTPAQAQQLALARLVLLDPHTLILDEATSLLDPNSARDLERGMNRVLEGRTVIAIAHRLHTARDADRVIVVDAGRIVEDGTHDELVAAGGAYARLWRSWHGG